MKNPFQMIAIMAFAFSLISFQGIAKNKFRLNLSPGTTYEMTTTLSMNMDQEMMGQKMQMENTMEIIQHYKVAEILANKNYLLEFSTTRMKANISANGQIMNIDSDNADSSESANFKKVIGHTIKLEINSLGKVEKADGMIEFLKALGGDKTVEQMLPMFASEDGFKSFMNQTFGYIPEEKVALGDKWSTTAKLGAPINMETKINYELLSVSGDEAKIKVNATFNGDSAIEQAGMSMNMNIDGNQEGTMMIDTTDGWMRSSDLTQDIKMIMKMKNPQTGEDMEFPINMKSVTNIVVSKK